MRGTVDPAVIGGAGDADPTKRKLAAFDFDAVIHPDWRKRGDEALVARG